MDKSCHSSGGGGDSSVVSSATTTTTSGGSSSSSSSNRDVYLKQLNKISHKISKPIRRPSPSPPPPPPVIEPQQQQNQSHSNMNHQVQSSQSQPQNLQQQQQQHQPPVYNINKSDFRDVVQRLTGSPAHERLERFSNPAPRPPAPPAMQQSKPASSRLQRIRPPPLAQISNRPPNLLNCAAPSQPHSLNPMASMSSGGFLGGQRQPLSPLPPFPTVHAAAESPISAYMRYLQNSVASASACNDADLKRFPPPPPPLSPLAPPRWNNLAPPPPLPPLQQQNIPPPFPLPPHQQQQNIPPPPTTSSAAVQQFPAVPTSPLPFGCLPSSGLLSPSLLFSPTGQLGFPQLPLSPTVPVSSPKWNGI